VKCIAKLFPVLSNYPRRELIEYDLISPLGRNTTIVRSFIALDLSWLITPLFMVILHD
jgi:hypothetical protein